MSALSKPAFLRLCGGVIFVFGLLMGCSPKPPAATARATSAEVAVLESANQAFNAHNADALTSLYAHGVKWFSVDSDKQSIEGENRDSIRQWLVGYFKSFPDVRGEISNVTQTGTHVSLLERVSWTAADGKNRTQSSIAVYEVRAGKIHRVWYFPAVRETPPASSTTADRKRP